MVWNHFRNKNFHKCRSGDKHRSHLFHRAPRISYLARSQQGCSIEDFREFVILRFILSLQSPLHTFVLGSSMNILSLANEPFQCSPSIFRRRQSPLQQGRAVLSQKCSPNWFSQLFLVCFQAPAWYPIHLCRRSRVSGIVHISYWIYPEWGFSYFC